MSLEIVSLISGFPALSILSLDSLIYRSTVKKSRLDRKKPTRYISISNTLSINNIPRLIFKDLLIYFNYQFQLPQVVLQLAVKMNSVMTLNMRLIPFKQHMWNAVAKMVDLAQLGQVVRNSHFQRPNRSALIKESAFAMKRNWLMAYAVTKDVQIV